MYASHAFAYDLREDLPPPGTYITILINGNTMKEDGLRRFSVSMPGELVDEFDRMIHDKGYANRSQALADIVRARLVDHHQQLGNAEIAGTITLVYDHHRPHLQAALTDIQHDHHELIVSTLHVHLDHDNCLEVIIVRGKSREIRSLADRLIGTRGVKHGRLTMATSGKGLV